jgi:hypothetical protein
MFGVGSVGNLQTEVRDDFYLVIIVDELRLTEDRRNETDLNNRAVQQNTF